MVAFDENGDQLEVRSAHWLGIQEGKTRTSPNPNSVYAICHVHQYPISLNGHLRNIHLDPENDDHLQGLPVSRTADSWRTYIEQYLKLIMQDLI